MTMVDIGSLSSGLKLGEDGIWYSSDFESVSYPSHRNEACFSVEEDSFWFSHRNNCITSVVKSYPPRNNETIFDIGGGNGFVSAGLASAGFNVALVEPGPIGALNAKKRGINDVICATTEKAQFRKNSLPAVGLFDVIEHIEEDITFLKSIKELVKEGGYLYATVPSYGFLWSEEDVNAGHFRRYTQTTISEVLQAAGFQIEFSSYIFRLLPLPIFLLRTLPFKFGLSRKAKKRNISSDHVTHGGSKRKLLDSVLESEVNNLKQNKPMAFGGSCLVVGKVP